MSAHGKPFVAATDKLTCADFKVFNVFSQTIFNPVSPIKDEVLDLVRAKLAMFPVVARWVETMREECSGYL